MRAKQAIVCRRRSDLSKWLRTSTVIIAVISLSGAVVYSTDEIDLIRQTYIDEGVKVPPRSSFSTSNSTQYFGQGEINEKQPYSNAILDSGHGDKVDDLREDIGKEVDTSSLV